MENLFYTFNQTNSGGYFVQDPDAGVCETVIIEAVSAEEAFSKLCSIGDSVQGMFAFCSCCGERWSSYVYDNDGTKTPEAFGEPVEMCKKSYYREGAFVHYANGTKKYFKFI